MRIYANSFIQSVISRCFRGFYIIIPITILENCLNLCCLLRLICKLFLVSIMNVRRLLVFLFFSCWHVVAAQNTSNFTQFFINPYTLNPSFAGVDGQRALFLGYRKQWSGFPGSPTTMNLSYHAPLKAGLNIGVNVHNNSKSVLQNSGLLASFAYELKLGEQKHLRFGLSAGVSSNSVDLDAVGDPGNDPALQNILENNTSLLGNAGVSLHVKTLHIGAALPHLFSPQYIVDENFSFSEVAPFQSIIVHASNRFYLAHDKHIFEPYAVYRLNAGLPGQWEAAAVLHLNHTVWIGGSYRQDFGISGVGGIKLDNRLAVGASYSLKNTGLNELNSPSFEAQLSFLMGPKNKKADKKAEVYSFVSTVKPKAHKKTPAQLAAEKKKAEEEKKKQAEVLAKKEAETKQLEVKKAEEKLKQEEARKAEEQKQQQAKAKEAEALAKKQEEEKQLAAKAEEAKRLAEAQPVKKDSVVHNHTGGPRLKHEPLEGMSEVAHDEHGEEERISRLELHEDNPTEHHGDPVTAHPHAERHEFVKKGDHKDELDYGDYVIVGVFKSDVNAKHFSEGLKNLKFSADYGHSSLKNLWYVYLAQASDINKAKAERDKYRKMKMFRDAWLLTVHE